MNDSNDAASPLRDETPRLTVSSVVRLATGPDGRGPSAGTILVYVRDGLLNPVKDSSGRNLFRPSDAALALRIYAARRERHGATGRRAGMAGPAKPATA